MNKKQRITKIAELFKISEDHGVLQNVTNVTSYSTRDKALENLKNKEVKLPYVEDPYHNSDSEKKETKMAPDLKPRSLSTRYSPDRVGVQALRIDDDSIADPYTGKVYRKSEGYTLENGTVIPGGSVSLQTKI